MKNDFSPLIFFYTDIARSFRTSHIGYLYEIAQTFPVVLLSEKLDSETEKILKDKKLFPFLKEIIPIQQYTGMKPNIANILSRHKYFSKLAKNLILKYKPDIVFATGANIFESYLRRFAKARNIITISGVSFLSILPENIRFFNNLLSAYNRFPVFLPKSIKILLAKYRRYLAHLFYFWICPLLVGQKPFMKEPSCILWNFENTEGADYYFVYCKEDFNILTKANVPAQKLFILNHPLCGKGRQIFDIAYFSKAKNSHKFNSKVLTIMWPDSQISFKRENYSFIPSKDLWKNRLKLINLIIKTLDDWKIFIKPHPSIGDNSKEFQKIVRNLEPISNQIRVVNPSEPADKYMEISDVVAALTTCMTLFTGPMQRSQKPFLLIDLFQEFFGDYFKNFPGIEYIDSEDKLIDTLRSIKNGEYSKIQPDLKPEGFSSIVEAIKWIFKTQYFTTK